MKALIRRLLRKKGDEADAHEAAIEEAKRHLERLEMQVSLYERRMETRQQYKRGRGRD